MWGGGGGVSVLHKEGGVTPFPKACIVYPVLIHVSPIYDNLCPKGQDVNMYICLTGGGCPRPPD